MIDFGPGDKGDICDTLVSITYRYLMSQHPQAYDISEKEIVDEINGTAGYIICQGDEE